MNFRINKVFFLGFVIASSPSIAQWKPAGDKIKTEWAAKINPEMLRVTPNIENIITERYFKKMELLTK